MDTILFHGVTVARLYDPFPGDAFATLFRPFERRPSTSADIRIRIKRVDAKASPDRRSRLAPRFFFGAAQVYDGSDGYVISDGYSSVEARFDPLELDMVLSAAGERAMPGMVRALQHLGFGLLLRERGLFELHASAVIAGQRAVVVVGDCGSGKTTTALALLASGGHYLGDDRILLQDGEPVGLRSYPREFHVDDRTARAFGLAVDSRAERVEGKFEVEPWLAAPERHVSGWNGEVSLLFPRIGDQSATHLTAITRAEAFGRLLGSSALAFVDGARHREAQLAVLKKLADRATALELVLGRDVMDRPAAAGLAIVEAVGRA